MVFWTVDARAFSSRPTGVGMYACRQLRKLMAAGDVRFVLLTDVAESEELLELERLGCEIRAYGRRVFRSAGVLKYFSWLARQVDELRPDVFWEPNNLLPFRPKGVARVIVTFHDVFALRGWSWHQATWHLYCRLAFWCTLACVTEVWYNSNATRRQVEAYVDAHRLSSPFALLQAFPALPATVRLTRPIADVPTLETIPPWNWAHPYFLYLGNVEGRKGADILVEAFRRFIHDTGAKVDLVVAGLERDVKVPDEPGFVRLGYVDTATKFSLVKSCTAVIVPSRDEGYGMQLAEALKLGARVIASDVPVFDEVVEENGSLFQNVTWLKGFVAGTDETRVTLLADALAAVAKECVGA